MNLILENFDWILGISGILLQYFYIKKYWWAPIAGLLYQPLWVVYICITREYGFILPTVIFTALHGYGAYIWIKEKK